MNKPRQLLNKNDYEDKIVKKTLEESKVTTLPILTRRIFIPMTQS